MLLGKPGLGERLVLSEGTLDLSTSWRSDPDGGRDNGAQAVSGQGLNGLWSLPLTFPLVAQMWPLLSRPLAWNPPGKGAAS
jgi:hypothetical protein